MTLAIELSDEVYAALTAESEELGYGSPAEFAAKLLQGYCASLANDELRLALQAGLDSGPPIPVNAEYWASMRARIAAAAAQ